MRDIHDELRQAATALSGIDGAIQGTGEPTLAGGVVQVAEALRDIASAIRDLSEALSEAVSSLEGS